MSRLVVLEDEAAQALCGRWHPKRRQVLAHVDVVALRKRRRALIRVGVPTAVRVEAGWDRRDQRWALANQLVVVDLPLERIAADTGAAIRTRVGVSVADAHLGAAAAAAPEDEVVVLTSDPTDVLKVVGGRAVRVVAL